MTKEEILKLYMVDLNNLVADGDAKRSRLIDLEDELESIEQGESLSTDSGVKSFTEKQVDDAYDKGFEDGFNKMYDNVI
tara:strand:+ start:2340 stop:2576 length:237 start_codon:yes stop_codon:yes gene_type:complete